MCKYVLSSKLVTVIYKTMIMCVLRAFFIKQSGPCKIHAGMMKNHTHIKNCFLSTFGTFLNSD
jgi:hypothetical protein